MSRKAPAFQLYVDDFLSGTIGFSDSEAGAFIRLLCLQWSKGGIDERSFRVCDDKDALAFVLKEKFELCEDGLWRNRRLEEVRNKSWEFSQKMAENGRKGGRPKNQFKSQYKPVDKPNEKPEQEPESNLQKNSPSPSPSPSPITLSLSQAREEERSTHWKESEFRTVWADWIQHVREKTKGVGLSSISAQTQLYELEKFSTEEAIAVVRFSIAKNANNLILNGDHKRKTETRGSPKPKVGAAFDTSWMKDPFEAK